MSRGWWLTLAGAAMLLLAGVLTGLDAYRPSGACPTDPPRPAPASAEIFATQTIRLHAPVCLKLHRKRFFAKEREALDPKALAFEAAAKDRAAKEAAKAAAEASSRAAPGNARAAAQLQAATAAASEAEKKAGEAKAALDQLPQRRKIFLLVDEVKVPMEGREVAIRPPEGSKDEWLMESIPLRRTDDASTDDGKTWRKILGGPTQSGTRKVKLGVAVGEGADQQPVLRAELADQAELQVFRPWLVVLGGVGLVILAAGVAMLGWNTGLLRDGTAGTPFSLGRVQMAWWLVLTVGGFLFIWLVSGQWKGLVTAGVIGLLGISATTGVAARMVDTTDGSGAAPPPGTTTPRTSTNFLTDLVDDGDGPALHRIQLLGWTVILGAIFVWTVVSSFGFPDFDTNLLLLAGIAGGTYLGFKFKES